MKQLHSKIRMIILIAVAVMILFSPRLAVFAQENFTSDYSQTKYTEDDGFESGEANCISQSASGYIWVGTDSGLYRYDGSQFRKFSLGEDSDSSSYMINSILAASNGNLYVGTENYGLFIYKDGRFNRISNSTEDEITTVRGLYEDEEGKIWLATSSGIYYYESGEMTLVADDDVVAPDVTAISGYRSYVYAIVNNDTIVNIKDDQIVSKISKMEYTEEDLNSLFVDENGERYIGTVGHTIIHLTTNKDFELLSTAALSGINKIQRIDNKLWVLADDGVGYINKNKKMKYVTGLEFNESMSDIIQDFEGNYWMTSYRKGLMLLSRSKFQNGSMKYGLDETIVNCITEYCGKLYIGTDDGLRIINADGTLDRDSDLVTMLNGKSIRDFCVDSKNNLWICSYRIYGVIKVNSKGKYKFYNKSGALLTSNAVNCIIELKDGSMAIGTESGISILKDEQVTVSYGRFSGMENADIISLYQAEDGTLYAGSNGSGLYTIDMESNLKKISMSEGLNSNVVSSIVGGSNGIWIGTDNGLYYQEGVIRQISAVDPSNSVANLILDQAGDLWIFGSRGIQKYYEGDLLSSADPKCEIYTKNDGLISDITDNSTNYISEDGVVYVCCDTGFSMLDQNQVFTNEVPPKVRIASVTIDDKEYAFSDLDGKMTVPGDTNRIVIKFSVLSYVNRGDIQVKYYLDGFDDKDRVVSGTDNLEAEYTNLEGGNYTFVLSAENSDGVACEEPLSFVIVKQLKFWETPFSRVLIVVLIIAICVAVIFVARYVIHLLGKKTEQVEELSKKNEQAERSNRAKNDYVNYLNHEIRVPLNSILAISEMLLRNDEAKTEEEVKQLSTVYGSSYEILGIIDGISRLSNLQDGTLELQEKEYAVSDMIEELAVQFKEMINRDLVALKVSIEDDIPNGLIGDRDKVKEILLNLYQRAAKTTKEGSISIEVDWRKIAPEECDRPDSIYLDIVISDTGTGVKEERLDSFFDLDDSYDRTDIGNFDISIGLAIARQLIESMGGTPEVDSTYGAGTTIRFSIIQQVFDYSYVNYNVSKRREQAFRNSNSRIWLPDVRILLVDDSDVSIQIQKVIFDSYELICDTASSGFEAIDKVMVTPYDMIFIDTVMPVMDGADTVREIRSLDGEEYKRVPIIALSENNIDSSRDEIIKQGFSDVLVKPLEMDGIEGIFRLFLPEDKIKEKTSNIRQYISESRFKDDVYILENSIVVENALKMIGGNFDTFNRFIAAFKEDYEPDVDRLEEYIDDDVRRYRNIIHDIKSSSGNIGAYSIERKAANLESAINIGNMQYAKENTHEFVSMLKRMFKDIGLYLAKINPVEQQEKTVRDAVDRGQLKDMRTFLRDADVGAVKEILAEIDRYEYNDADIEFLNALKMTVDAMDYEGASEIIDQYLNSK